MKKIILLLSIALCVPLWSLAQYTETGKIEYERKINMHRQMEGNECMEKFISQIPKFQTHYFDLSFVPDKTIYKAGREIEQPKMPFGGDQMSGKENVIYTDYASDKITATKEIFEQTFLIQDSVRKIDWKITNEIRTVANFKCRKAVGKMFDSVYVVAFYTDDIPTSGGPEMFGGLPGMILELAIPRLYATWVATKVEVAPVTEATLTPPVKGKKTTQKELGQTLQATFRQWPPDMRERNFWWSII